MAIRVRRAPLPKAMEEALANVASLTTSTAWDLIKKEEGIDALMHLALLVTTEDGRISQLEKNAGTGLTFSLNIDSPEGAEYRAVHLSHDADSLDTVNIMLARTRSYQGPDRYYLYDAFDANCQDFVWSFLASNHIATPELKTFVLQPTKNIVEKAFSPAIQAALGAYTDARTLYGSGRDGHGDHNGRIETDYV